MYYLFNLYLQISNNALKINVNELEDKHDKEYSEIVELRKLNLDLNETAITFINEIKELNLNIVTFKVYILLY